MRATRPHPEHPAKPVIGMRLIPADEIERARRSNAALAPDHPRRVARTAQCRDCGYVLDGPRAGEQLAHLLPLAVRVRCPVCARVHHELMERLHARYPEAV